MNNPDELEQRIDAIVRDPRISAEVRAALRGYLAAPRLDATALMDFGARAIAVIRLARTDPTARAALTWALDLAHLVGVSAPTPTPPAPAQASARATTAPRSAAYFSPGDACLEAIIQCFREAERTADVCVFTITDDRIRQSMESAHRRGVRVRVVSDNDKALDEGSDIEALGRAGIACRLDRTEAHMHHKFAVFDGARLLNGSYNWTRSAARYNQENIVATDDPALVRAFGDEFERLWGSLAG